MKLTEHTFAELSALKYRIFTTCLPNVPNKDILIAAARAAWGSSCFSLDYRALEYEWGDGLLVQTGYEEVTQETAATMQMCGAMPDCSATLISNLNREAITSLLRSEYGQGLNEAWQFQLKEVAPE